MTEGQKGNKGEEVAAGQPAARFDPTTSEIVKCALCAGVAVVAVAGKPTGFIAAPWPEAIAAAILFALLAAANLLHGMQTPRMRAFWRRARPFVVVLSLPVAFFLLEQPFNDALFSMDLAHLAANLCLLAVLYAALYFLCQRAVGGVVAFVSVCFALGIADYFVYEFKGQPVMPADLLALSTAASVSTGYEYEVDGKLLACFVLFVFWLTLIAFLPKVERGGRRTAVNLALALAFGGGFGAFFALCPVDEALDGEVELWAIADSYEEHGTLLSFLDLCQELVPAEPEGYDGQEAEELLAEQEADEVDASAVEEEELPTVVVVMNETFSDLSRYPGLEDSEARPENFYAIAEESLLSGTAYVSALGGGTCNSEFEFLTGSSMSSIGGGTYPYLVCDLEGCENLASYFGALGYETHAIHPSEATNWSRNEVYEDLGFDDFTDVSAFEDADTLRGLVTDAASYDKVLELIEEGEGPQFIFDVTIQNHSGYDRGGIDEEDAVDIELPDGTSSAELDEYESCLNQSDEDLACLVESLNELDEPVVLCFFGDHEPDLSYWLFKQTHDGQAPEDLGLESVQERFCVPYLIWANDAAIEAGMVDGTTGETQDTSLNYLGSTLVDLCGLPLTSYQSFLLAAKEEVPALNMNGFMDAEGEWHWLDEETDAETAGLLEDYAALQYANLYDKSSERSELWLTG